MITVKFKNSNEIIKIQTISEEHEDALRGINKAKEKAEQEKRSRLQRELNLLKHIVESYSR